MRSRAESLRNLNQADYTAQLKAMIAHDTGAIAPKANVLVVVSAQDQMVNPAPARDWARANGAELVTLTGDCGHLATACEEEVMRREVHRFLDR
jgi:homoserine O-acetyltransferase